MLAKPVFALSILKLSVLEPPRNISITGLNLPNGLTVKNGDIQAMAEKLLTLLTNERLRVRFSKNSINYSHNFSWDVTACEFLRIAMNTYDLNSIKHWNVKTPWRQMAYVQGNQ